MYRYIEQAFRLTSDKRLNHAPLKFLASSAAGVAILLIPTVHAMHNGGWEWRLNDSVILEIETADYNCRDYQKASKDESSCTIGAAKAGPADMLLIGDSHAEHLVTGFDYLGKKHNLKIDMWTHYGCPPISGTFVMKKFGSQHWREQCREQIEKWEDFSFLDRQRTKVLTPEHILNVKDCVEQESLIPSLIKIMDTASHVGIVFSDAILLNIALVRAIRILRERLNMEGDIIGMVSCGSEVVEYQLIRMTSQAMAIKGASFNVRSSFVAMRREIPCGCPG